MKPYFAIVNPAAGGGRCGRQAPAALDRLRSQGLSVESVETQRAEHATSLCRDAYRGGFRRFLAVGETAPASRWSTVSFRARMHPIR